MAKWSSSRAQSIQMGLPFSNGRTPILCESEKFNDLISHIEKVSLSLHKKKDFTRIVLVEVVKARVVVVFRCILEKANFRLGAFTVKP